MSRTAARTAAALATTAAVLAMAASPAAAATAPEPPAPPAVTADPPDGARPGPAPGLRSPERCAPPPADDGPITAGAGAGRLRLGDVHRLATGRGQVIAVIDTGVAPHPLLGDRLRGGGDHLTGGDGLDDCDGHGTAVAGLIAAAAPRGRDGRPRVPLGIAPDAEILSIRQSSLFFEVTEPDGTVRPAGDTGTLAQAVVLAVREGADVINISEAVCLTPRAAAAAGARLQAALRFAAEAGVVIVAAAGNRGVAGCGDAGPEQVSLPGWYDPDILTVGAVGPDDAPAPFTVPGPWVDVAAPGSDLRSLAVDGGTRSTGIAGTSFAAPWVAGLAALVRERFPDLDAQQVVDRILATARRPAGGGGDTLGAGVVDPVAALTAVPAVLAPPVPPGAADAGPTAELPGTAPRAATPAPPPVDLMAGATLLVAAAAAATLLRRRPGRAG